jgi:hypothetical protein
MDITFNWGEYTICQTCVNRRRWSTDKTHGVYCLSHKQGKGMVRFVCNDLEGCNHYRAKAAKTAKGKQ